MVKRKTYDDQHNSSGSNNNNNTSNKRRVNSINKDVKPLLELVEIDEERITIINNNNNRGNHSKILFDDEVIEITIVTGTHLFASTQRPAELQLLFSDGSFSNKLLLQQQEKKNLFSTGSSHVFLLRNNNARKNGELAASLSLADVAGVALFLGKSWSVYDSQGGIVSSLFNRTEDAIHFMAATVASTIAKGFSLYANSSSSAAVDRNVNVSLGRDDWYVEKISLRVRSISQQLTQQELKEQRRNSLSYAYSQPITIPVYSWIEEQEQDQEEKAEPKYIFFVGKASLPQLTSLELSPHRQALIDYQRKIYRLDEKAYQFFHCDCGGNGNDEKHRLPSPMIVPIYERNITTLNEQYLYTRLPNNERNWDLAKKSWDVELFKRFNVTDSIRLGTILLTSSKFPSLDKFELLYHEGAVSLPIPPMVAEKNRWRSDEEFARNFLQGEHANVIQKYQYDSLPSQLKSLTIVKKAFEEKKLFVVDHSVSMKDWLTVSKSQNSIGNDGESFDDHNANSTKKYISNPLIFFAQKPILVPVAIILRPHLPNARVYTPADGEWIWMAAKMYAMAADKNYQQLITHLLNVHLTHGVISVAYKSNLAPIHPVYQLLGNHFVGAISMELFNRVGQVDVNSSSKESNETPIQFIMASSVYHHHNISLIYKNWNFHDLNLKRDLIKRGFTTDEFEFQQSSTTPSSLNNYYYAEDGILIWNAIHNYVSDTLKVHYHRESVEETNKLIEGDIELQQFWHYLITVGFKGSATPYFKFTTFAEVCDSVTTMIWIVSGYHNAINASLYQWSSFPPFRPMAMYKPVEVFENELSRIDEKWICEALPDGVKSFMQMSAYFGLSQKSAVDHGLGKQVQQMNFEDEGVRIAAKRFSDSLNSIEKIVKERNSTVHNKFPYTYLQPSAIPNYAV